MLQRMSRAVKAGAAVGEMWGLLFRRSLWPFTLPVLTPVHPVVMTVVFRGVVGTPADLQTIEGQSVIGS
jgi:hypothetical protein